MGLSHISYNCDRKSYGLNVYLNFSGKSIILGLITFVLMTDIRSRRSPGSS